MSGFIGSDPEELHNLARHMDGSADQLDGVREQLGARFQSVRWAGADAERAKEEFRTLHVRKIAQAAVMLRDTAARVRKNAQEQTTASSGAGAGSGGSGLEIGTARPLYIDGGLPTLQEPFHALPDRLNVADVPGLEVPFQTLPDRLDVADVPEFLERPVDQMSPIAYEAFSEPETP